MSTSPKISIIGSSIRDDRWNDFYENLNQRNDIEFEIVFCGNSNLTSELPSNFNYIYSQTKPAQCVEISARYAKGELLMVSSDDLLFGDHFLDNLYEHYQENCSNNDFVSANFKRKGYEYTSEDFKFWRFADNSPLMPMNLTLKKEIWHEIGGVDKNFMGLFYDLDLALRLMERGGLNFKCEKAISEEIFSKDSLRTKIEKKILSFLGKKRAISLYEEIGIKMDKPMLNSFWVKDLQQLNESEEFYSIFEDKVHVKNRLLGVESFSDKDLREVSQGPKGRWN